MQTWNDFFSRQNDNKPLHPVTHKETNRRIYDDFEHDYMKKYGIWFDHHYLKLIQNYGSEKAEEMIKANVDALNEEILQTISESTFIPIPDGTAVPF